MFEFAWEKTAESGGNLPVQPIDHMTSLHVDAGYETQITGMRGKCIITSPAEQSGDQDRQTEGWTSW